MVNGFEEEVKALEEYGHDCCARIDDRIHECCKRIREAHEQELDNTRYAYEVSMALMKEQPSPVTYDVLDNERHKAVCELRKLPKDFGDIWVWKRRLGDAIGSNEMYSDIQSRIIHLLGGDQMPVTLSDLFGIWKEDGDGVDAGGCVEAGDDRAVCGADGRVADSTGDSHAEGVAPITQELREHLAEFKPIDTGDSIVVSRIGTIGYEKAMQLCDAIDAIHANLERDVEMWRDRAEDMRMERDDALKEYHEWAPESHYMMLPKDSDGIPVHIGDVMEWPDTSTAEVVGVYENGFFYVEGDDDILADWTTAHDKIHHEQETVEGILREFALSVAGKECMSMRKGVVEEFAKRLTLAGDAE